MLLFDQHTHSLNSHERASISSVEEMCEGALLSGMAGIAVTDHYDLGRRTVEQVSRPSTPIPLGSAGTST